MTVGQNVEDSLLVAALMVHGLSHLLTFDSEDLTPYRGAIITTPADLLTSWETNAFPRFLSQKRVKHELSHGRCPETVALRDSSCRWA